MQETEIYVGASHFEGKGTSIVIPKSSGILEGIRNQSMGNDEVRIELPQNWFQIMTCWDLPYPAFIFLYLMIN